MTNLILNCSILQYVYYDPLHVSNIICSSSGGWIVLMQDLVSSLSVSGCPVHRLRENCVLSQPVVITYDYTKMHGPQNIKMCIELSHVRNETLNSTLQGFDNCAWLNDKTPFFGLCLSPNFFKHHVSEAGSASVFS